jgi:hypothetical protein
MPPKGARRSRRGAVVVDPDVTADQLAANPVGRFRIRRRNRAGQASPRVVRRTDGAFLGLEGEHGNHRTELLFGDDAQREFRIDHEGRALMLASTPVTTLSTPGSSCLAIRSTIRVVANGAVRGGFTLTVWSASSACGNAAPRTATGPRN